MKKRVILILCVLAVLLTAVICLPFARKIDTTVTATEYRFDDPAYAVEHTVVICGHDPPAAQSTSSPTLSGI